MAGRKYAPRAQRQWYRIDAPWTAQGHALEAKTQSSTYQTWEEPDGRWWLLRYDDRGDAYGPVEVGSLPMARIMVAQVEATLAGKPLSEKKLHALVAAERRAANPADDAFNADLRNEFLIRGGLAALAGAIVGALIGGTPGILMGNAPVTSVGAHVGSIMGAATGAFVGGYHLTDEEREIRAIKKRCLER